MRLVLALIAIAATAAPSHAEPALVHGVGGFSQRALAVVDDGSAAVTADVAGGVRLWPSLDGKLEPVAIAATPPAALAIARDGDDVAVVGLDAAGGVELVRVSRLGAPSSRAALAIDRPVIEIGAVAGGVVALRDDETIALFDLRGAAAGVLVPDPGERIASIVFRRDHALALITADGHVRGRWIDVAGARWGDRTPILPITGVGAALSPDLRHLAGASARTKQPIAIVDLVTGEATAHPAPPDLDEGERLSVLGYVGAHELAVLRDGEALGWWNAYGWTTPKDGSLGGAAEAADGQLVVGTDGALALVTIDATEYLGYRLVNPEIVRRVPGGLLVSDRQSIVRTDEHLHQLGEVPVPSLGTYRDVVPLDLHHALAFAGYSGSSASAVYQVDLDHGDKTTLVGSTDRGGLQYEPSTHLAAWETSTAIELARVDPRTGKVAEPVELAREPNRYDIVILLDASQGGGDLALVVHEEADQSVTVETIRGVTPGQAAVTGKQRTLSATASFWASPTDVRIFGYTAPLRRTSPDGKLTAELGAAGRITLRDGATERWTIAVATAHDLVWTAGGALIVVGAGLARVDLDDGSLAERQCGWRFGRSDQPIASGDGAICSAP